MHAASPIWNIGLARPSLAAILDPVIGPAIAGWLREVASGRRNPPCLLCEKRPGLFPGAFFFMLPCTAVPESAVVCGICRDCAARADRDILATTQEIWRPVLIGLRPTTAANLFAAGGRA